MTQTTQTTTTTRARKLGNLALALAMLVTAGAGQLGCDSDKDPLPPEGSDSSTAGDSTAATESGPTSGQGEDTGDSEPTSQGGSSDATTGPVEPTGDQCEGEYCSPSMFLFCAPGLECVTWEHEQDPQCRVPCNGHPEVCDARTACVFQPWEANDEFQKYCEPLGEPRC